VIKKSANKNKSRIRKTIRASKRDSERTAKLFTCGIHFQHEMADAAGPQVFYSSVTELKKAESCWKSCGIVELEFSFAHWIYPQKIENGLRRAKKLNAVQMTALNKRLKIRAHLWNKYINDLARIHVKTRKPKGKPL
jgi:hypothetical protein